MVLLTVHESFPASFETKSEEKKLPRVVVREHVDQHYAKILLTASMVTSIEMGESKRITNLTILRLHTELCLVN